MHIPTTLKHKPVLVAEDYGRIVHQKTCQSFS